MSEQGYNPGAEQGNNVGISAPGWNKLTSFNDEVANGVPRNIQLTPRKQVQQEKGRLNTLAKAEGDIERGDWLVITGVAIDSDDNDNLFNFDPRPTVKKIESTDSDVTLAVALDTIYDGKYGRICVTGCCIAKIDAPSGALYSHYDKDDVAADGVLTGTNTDTGLPIFWNNGTSGESMAFVGLNLGGGGGGGVMVPVDLVQVGGAQGTQTTAATWTYDVFRADERGTGPTALETAVDPTAAPSNWVRHLGHMSAATFGLAYYNVDGNLELTWINEQTITAECVA